MSDFKNIVEFFRLRRRSEEAEKNLVPETEILLNSIEDDTNYKVDKYTFETNFIKYKRIFSFLDDSIDEKIYILETPTERKYFVKISINQYRNLQDETLGIISTNSVKTLTIDFDTSAYIYDNDKNRVVTVVKSINEVVIFPDIISYDPNSEFMKDIEDGETLDYDYKDDVTTFGKIIKVLFDNVSYIWENPDKKVNIIKANKAGKINLIPYLDIDYRHWNYILKYRYYEKGYRPKNHLNNDECAIVIKFTSIGGLLSYLNETLFSQGFSIEEGENENIIRDYFRDQFMNQIIKAVEDSLKYNPTKKEYEDAMKTLFYLPESVTSIFSDDFLWMLLEMAIKGDSLTNKTNIAEENIFVKLLKVILEKEGREVRLMNWFLEVIKDGDKNVTKFEFIYDRINGANFIEFVKLINKAWKKSRFIYPDTEKNPEFATTDGPLFLPYSSEKTLGFYFSNVSLSFETHHQKERLLKTEYETGRYTKEMKPGLKTDNLVPTQVQIVDQFWYHPFYPIYLKDIENQETDMKLDSIVPAFMLKANRDKQFWSNVVTTAEYAADILTTISGVGNIAKFRYLAKFASKAGNLRFVSEAGRAVVAARKAVAATAAVVEITSGTVNALLKLTSARDTEWGKALSEYLFWLELLSLSGELTVAIHNGLRKNAKEILEHEDDLRKTTKNADEAKQVDDVIEELKNIVDDRFKQLNSIADPVADILGAAYKSHPERLNEITSFLKSKKVEIVYKDREVMAYAPLEKGKPGQLQIHKEASISAWEHELIHYLDDEAAGFLGGGSLYNFNYRVTTELNAYKAEIEFVKKLNGNNLAAIDQLKKNFQGELEYIEIILNTKVSDKKMIKRINELLNL